MTEKETDITLEYYLDKDLYNISMSALKEAMQGKSTPYVPLQKRGISERNK